MAPAACEADMRPRCSRKPAIKRLSNSTEVNDCKGRQKVLSAGRDWGRIIRELLERSGGRVVVNTSITDPTASRKFTWLRNSPKPPAGAQLQKAPARVFGKILRWRFRLICALTSPSIRPQRVMQLRGSRPIHPTDQQPL